TVRDLESANLLQHHEQPPATVGGSACRAAQARLVASDAVRVRRAPTLTRCSASTLTAFIVHETSSEDAHQARWCRVRQSRFRRSFVARRRLRSDRSCQDFFAFRSATPDRTESG